MTEPEPTYTAEPISNDVLAERILELRRAAIGLTVSYERLLDYIGYPVESAIVTRQERRRVVRQRIKARSKNGR
jgi:hypothetical protein